tara:strand:+ start:2856 stop:3809 length:954 start_codon:yes stop_codon:yes gene_type:complete
MNEDQIINHLRKIIKNPYSFNLNDDVFFDKKKSLVVSIDTFNENIHYPGFKSPDLILKKVIRSSISDIIAKGADPKYILIAFSGSNKHFNKKNVRLIIKSIKQEQKKYKFSLIGGDTTASNKSSFTICVFSYPGNIVKRNSCALNEDIYVTGNLGDSSVGLSFLKNKITSSSKNKNYFIKKFFKPTLAFGFNKELKKFASSSMDISDGLLIDLKKMVSYKKLGFMIDFNLIPTSIKFKNLVDQKKISIYKHLFAGDDYQIIFTAKNKYREFIIKYSKKWNQKVTRIGIITNTRSNFLKINKKLKEITDYQGYIHKFR